MALDVVGPLKWGNPHSLLPLCQYASNFSTNECWRKVVTDKGICYSTLTGMERH